MLGLGLRTKPILWLERHHVLAVLPQMQWQINRLPVQKYLTFVTSNKAGTFTKLWSLVRIVNWFHTETDTRTALNFSPSHPDVTVR